MIRAVFATLCLLGYLPLASATDILRLGSSAATQGVAGVMGLSADAMTAVSGNPALLAGQARHHQFTASLLQVDSTFVTSLAESTSADRGPGLIPELAMVLPIADTAFTFGAGVAIQSAMRADFEFQDPPGTSGTSYGRQIHRAEFLVAKIAAALAWQLTPDFALGASAGLAYNRNQLQAPYTFQTHPLLSGSKVLVDLDADDVAMTGSLGLKYQLADGLGFNLSYQFATEFSPTGSLDGNLGMLGLGIEEEFTYRSRIATTLPASLSVGLNWQTSAALQLGLQLDWIDWENAFDTLPLRLTRGSNAELNAILGTDTLNDTAPLAWKRQKVLHLGASYQYNAALTFRAGLERSNVPVPSATVTPMTAALFDRAYSLGLMFQLGERQVDLAWRVGSADTSRVVNSSLVGGEYNNTSQDLRLYTLALSVSL